MTYLSPATSATYVEPIASSTACGSTTSRPRYYGDPRGSPLQYHGAADEHHPRLCANASRSSGPPHGPTDLETPPRP